MARRKNILVPVCGECHGPLAAVAGPAWLQWTLWPLRVLAFWASFLCLLALLFALFVQGAGLVAAIKHKPTLDAAGVSPDVQRRAARAGEISGVELAALSAEQRKAVEDYVCDARGWLDELVREQRERDEAAYRQMHPDWSPSSAPATQPVKLNPGIAALGFFADSPVLWGLLFLAAYILHEICAAPMRTRRYVCGGTCRASSSRFRWLTALPRWSEKWQLERQQERLERAHGALQDLLRSSTKAEELKASRAAVADAEVRIRDMIKQLSKQPISEAMVDWEGVAEDGLRKVAGEGARTWAKRVSDVTRYCVNIHMMALAIRALIERDSPQSRSPEVDVDDVKTKLATLSEQLGRFLYCWYHSHRKRGEFEVDLEVERQISRAWDGVGEFPQSGPAFDHLLNLTRVQDVALKIVYEAHDRDFAKFQAACEHPEKGIPVRLVFDGPPITTEIANDESAAELYQRCFDPSEGPKRHGWWRLWREKRHDKSGRPPRPQRFRKELRMGLTEHELRQKLVALPVYAQVALAARAGRYAERALSKDWLMPELHAAAATLLALCEMVAEQGSWLSPGMPRPGGEEALERLVEFGRKAPRESVGAAIYSIHEAAHTAMMPYFVKDDGARARIRLMDRSVPAIVTAVTALMHQKRGEVAVQQLGADVSLICEAAENEDWDDKTRVPKNFFDARA